MADNFGELIPVGGGDTIPLLKKRLKIGRRESCDLVLRFANVSAHHCLLIVNGGYWYVKDLGSRNGVKVNNMSVTEKRLDPGDILSVARHKYEIQYSPLEMGAVGPPPAEEPEDILSKSLLERAGLGNNQSVRKIRDKTQTKRYDPNDDRPGQIDDPDKPIT